MRMEYLTGLSFEEACTLFCLHQGHINNGDYSRYRDNFAEECQEVQPFIDFDYDYYLSQWLN